MEDHHKNRNIILRVLRFFNNEKVGSVEILWIIQNELPVHVHFLQSQKVLCSPGPLSGGHIHAGRSRLAFISCPVIIHADK